MKHRKYFNAAKLGIFFDIANISSEKHKKKNTFILFSNKISHYIIKS